MKGLKFKVWDTVRQKMFKPQGITFDTSSLTPFAVKISGRSWEPVGKFELIQWISLCDSNGDDVYEGDFIKISSALYKVTWNKTTASFELVGLKNSAKRSIADVVLGEIVGNQFQDIHPNYNMSRLTDIQPL